jgi:hypothetical protein
MRAIGATLLVVVWAGVAGAASAPATKATRAAADSGMTMPGGREGTVFRSLTVEGEDRIRIDVERPSLKLTLDPTKAPGLDWGSARDVLERSSPDLDRPLLQASAGWESPQLARPYLTQFSSGAVARFRPQLTDVERWKLEIVRAGGTPVASFEGKGSPPREIVWDGTSTTGEPVAPGATYSYVVEARDKAGNRRHFVGEGFSVEAYRLSQPEGPVLVLTGADFAAATSARAPGASGTPAIALEAASWINQAADAARPVQVKATARSREYADALAQAVVRAMQPVIVGNPARLRAVGDVRPDAPESGAIEIRIAR